MTCGAMARRGQVLLILALLSAWGALSVQAAGAGDAAHFLRDGLGATGRAVGSAHTALASDYTAAFWNPAPAVQSSSTVIGGGLEQRNAGLFTFNVLGGRHVSEGWSAGLVVITSDMYDVYHAAAGLRFGTISAGIGLRSYQFGVPGDRGSGLGFDVGARYAFAVGHSIVALAAVSRDIGWTPIRWGEPGVLSVDRAAWVNRLAVALKLPLERGDWTFELDGELATRRPPEVGESDYWMRAGDLNVSVGAAFRWEGIFVRAGIQRFDLLGSSARLRPTLGFGIAIGGLTVDLALIPSPLGSTYLGGFQVEL